MTDQADPAMASDAPETAGGRGFWRHLLMAPLIYGVALPVLLCDIAVSLYQAICFRVWGISQVRRSAYIRFDRHKLAYLDPIQRLNCLYCSYANGAFAYFVEVASKTEKYWCPIQEAEPPPAAHRRYASFLAHGDAENLRARLARQRADLLQEDD